LPFPNSLSGLIFLIKIFTCIILTQEGTFVYTLFEKIRILPEFLRNFSQF